MTAVDVVAYGDEVHVYPAGSAAARILHTTAVGANLDAELYRLGAARWRDVRGELPGTVTVHDHTADETAAAQ